MNAMFLRPHLWEGDGQYCQHWSTGRPMGNPKITGTITMSTRCGYPRDCHLELGSQWVDVETGETITVEEFDGAYAVVTGERPETWRGPTHSGKPNAFLVQPSHFGRTYTPKEG